MVWVRSAGDISLARTLAEKVTRCNTKEEDTVCGWNGALLRAMNGTKLSRLEWDIMGKRDVKELENPNASPIDF